MRRKMFGLLCLTGFFAGVVPAAPETGDIPTAENVDLSRYAGLWYETARFPHRFEKNLSHVTATYTLREDGKVTVLNQGRKKNGKVSSITGKARRPDASKPGLLEVSFFLFFYSDYRIILLDPDYQYAVVTGANRDYLWILCRTPEMDPLLYERLVAFVEKNGFDTQRIQKVQQD